MFTWVLGNPEIIRHRGGGGGGGGMGVGGYRCLTPMNLGTRESQDTQTRGGSISWDLPVMYLELLYYILCYLGFHSILYERVLPFLDMSGRNAYIFIARGV